MNKPKEHNYKTKIKSMIENGDLPEGASLSTLNVYHDDFCSIFYGKKCDCNPTIKLDKLWEKPTKKGM